MSGMINGPSLPACCAMSRASDFGMTPRPSRYTKTCRFMMASRLEEPAADELPDCHGGEQQDSNSVDDRANLRRARRRYEIHQEDAAHKSKQTGSRREIHW